MFLNFFFKFLCHFTKRNFNISEYIYILKINIRSNTNYLGIYIYQILICHIYNKYYFKMLSLATMKKIFFINKTYSVIF